MINSNVRLFVNIVKTPFAYASFNMLGRPLSDFAERAVENLPHVVCECENNIEIPDNFDFLAVLYADMPLLSEEILVEAANVMRAKNISKIGLGKGYMTMREGKTMQMPSLNLNIKEFLSVNDTNDLRIVYNELGNRIIQRHVSAGALILDDNVTVDDTVIIKRNAEITAGSVLLGNTVIEEGAKIVASRIENSTIGKNATVGPYAYIRMNSVIGQGVRVGDFVEVKNSTLGSGVKSAHLTYIGDAEIGNDTNVGCGTVFCNYDGKKKHKTVVGSNVFIGANTNLVAPVSVGENAFIAAGTTVTDDLPENAFCIGRVRQTVKPKKG